MSKYKPSKIYLHGDVDTDMYTVLSQGLDEAEANAPKDFKGYIDIELVSDGGSAYDAIAMHDRIINCPFNIRITGSGLVASAAVLILAAGDHRVLTKNSWVMVHEDSVVGVEDKQVHEVEKEVKHYRRLEDQWCQLLHNSTYTDLDMWAKLHKDETYLTPKECLALGLIEEIK